MNNRRTILGIAILLLGIGAFPYWWVSFRVPLATPASIQLFVLDRESKSTNVTITTNTAPIVEVLRRGRPVEVHACKARAYFLLSYADGKTKLIDIQPGHNSSAYEFSAGKLYNVPRAEFFFCPAGSGYSARNIAPRIV